MNSRGFSAYRCSQIVDVLADVYYPYKKHLGKNISVDDINQLRYSCETEEDAENSDKFGEPMVWIGIYIAVASFFCILAMVADLFHGFRNKKFWFPCKYFSLNAASITVVTIAMKLPVDLSTAMPSFMDQATKLGSLGFMCVMMANFMPSLASMDNKTLLANVIGLSILVITVTVNICIQIDTSVINNTPRGYYDSHFDFVTVAYIYITMILVLLTLVISSSLTIPSSKEILDSKYHAIKKISSTDQCLRHIQMSKVEKLRQHVRRHWVMAETGSPQFVMAANPLSTASGIICALSLLMNLFLVFQTVVEGDWTPIVYKSQYKWSTVFIFVTHTIGVVVGAIAPIVRCFSVFRFKLAVKWSMNYFMFFKVENYWTQKLQEWKQSPVNCLSSSRRSRSITYNSRNIILSLCIGFQKAIVVACKLIRLAATILPLLVVMCLYGCKSFKVASRTEDTNKDLRSYVLQIDNELAEKTLNGVSNSINSFILKAVKEQNNCLLELLEKSNAFKGVEIFDACQVQPLLAVELVNSWSLPIVTLTCIATALPNIHNDKVESLMISVGEGLSYAHLVEENLNCASEYVNLRKASMALWHEVENTCGWLGNPLAKDVFKWKTTTEIIKWFSDRAKEIVIELNESTKEKSVENTPKTLIMANSMYRITQTILLRYQSNIEEPINHQQMFAHLNGMIADIFCACFTNIPRVITMRCHESVIEKREASVKVAAKLLGKTTKIIERLESRELPSMDEDKMAYIDEWRFYLKQSIP